MFVHYHAKVINAERVGGRLVRVACTRCGCEYFYKFTRIGVGSAQRLSSLASAQTHHGWALFRIVEDVRAAMGQGITVSQSAVREDPNSKPPISESESI
jgi:hypothetical protein